MLKEICFADKIDTVFHAAIFIQVETEVSDRVGGSDGQVVWQMDNDADASRSFEGLNSISSALSSFS